MNSGPINTYLEQLADESQPVQASTLIRLSAMSEEDFAMFWQTFRALTAERKLSIITEMVEMSDDDAEIDFSKILLKGLEDQNEAIRGKSIAGLWECEDRGLMKTLAAMVRADPSEGVRAAAAVGLRRFTTLAEMGKLLQRDRRTLARVLLEAIHDGKETVDVRRHALESLAGLSVPEVEGEIRAAYASEDTLIKASAVHAMGRTLNTSWLPTVIKELSSPDAELRFEAATACGEMEEQEAIMHLLPMIKDPDVQVRLAAITSMGQIGGPLAKQALQKLLESENEAVSNTAEEALAQLEALEKPA